MKPNAPVGMINERRKPMKSILTKIQVLGLLMALPVLAGDVGLHKGSAQPTRAAMLKKIQTQLTNICVSVTNMPVGIDINGNATLFVDVSPGGEVAHVLYDLIRIKGEVEARVLQQPVHGTFSITNYTDENINGIKTPYFAYIPQDKNYLGKDHAVFEVEALGQKFHVSYELHIVTKNTALLGGDCPDGGPVDEGASNTELLPDTNTFHLSPRRLG